MLAAVLVFLFNVIALVLATIDQGPRAPDGRRGGPIAVDDPPAADRETVAKLQAESAERARRDAENAAAAAEPAGIPPSDEQRQAIVDLEQRSATTRAAAARALRRHPVAVGVIYDDERDQVAQLQEQQRDRQHADMEARGIVDPAVEEMTAGFDPALEHVPGSDLYGTFECSTCGGTVERPFPGYVDPDAASRDLVCPHCGARFLRAGGAEAQPSAEAEQGGGAGVQSSAQTTAPQTAEPGARSGQAPAQTTETLETGEPGTYTPPPAAPLTDDERAELEQLRAYRAERLNQSGTSEAEATAAEGEQQPTPPHG